MVRLRMGNRVIRSSDLLITLTNVGNHANNLNPFNAKTTFV